MFIFWVRCEFFCDKYIFNIISCISWLYLFTRDEINELQACNETCVFTNYSIKSPCGAFANILTRTRINIHVYTCTLVLYCESVDYRNVNVTFCKRPMGHVAYMNSSPLEEKKLPVLVFCPLIKYKASYATTENFWCSDDDYIKAIIHEYESRRVEGIECRNCTFSIL